jgi:hypothetical protein
MNAMDSQRRLARTVALLASVMAFTMSAVYCASRIGFPTHYSSVARICGISFLLLNVAPFGRRRWFNGPAALTLLSLVLLCLAGWYLPAPSVVAWTCALLGYGLFLCNFWHCLPDYQTHKRTLLLLVVAALFVGLYVSGKHWGLGYNNPLAEERLAVNLGHIDAPFHSAIANMLRNYGRPSTGLDGLPYLAYHFGSHWVAASLAALTGQGLFEFYNSASGILFVPLMYAAFLGLAGLLRGFAQKEPEPTTLPGGFLFWAVALVGLIGPFPKKGDMLRVSLMEIYDSDSYTLGLAVSFLVLALAVSYYFDRRERSGPPAWGDKLALLMLFPLLFAACGLIKISLAYLLVGMAFFVCWRLGLWRQPLYLAHLAISAALAVALLRFATSRVDSHFALFTFDRIHPEWLPFFFAFYFFWVWAFAWLLFCRLHLSTLEAVSTALREGKLIPLEILLFCSLIGLVPYLLLRFNTGSWNYFTQYQTFLGLALTVAYLPAGADFFRARTQGWQQIPVRSVAIVLAGCLIGTHLLTTTASAVYGLVKDNAQIRAELAGYPEDAWRSHLRLLYGGSRGVVSGPAQARLATLASLRELGRIPRAEKRKTVLYIPKTYRAYWGDLRQFPGTEGTTPFIAPALSGLAMISGEPEYEDLSEVRRITYGYWSYPLPQAAEEPSDLDLATVRKRAASMGFEQLIVLGSSGVQRLSTP